MSDDRARPASVTDDEVRAWAIAAARAADDKKADDVVVLDVSGVLGITDFFVIASAPNTRLVRTIADAVEEQVAAAFDLRPRKVEGRDELAWVLADYGDIVVHVFLDETRRFYDLERLWSDVPRVRWQLADQSSTGAAHSG
jgi:ribosome-associated protein